MINRKNSGALSICLIFCQFQPGVAYKSTSSSQLPAIKSFNEKLNLLLKAQHPEKKSNKNAIWNAKWNFSYPYFAHVPMESNTLHTPTVHTETIQVIAYDSQEHKSLKSNGFINKL